MPCRPTPSKSRPQYSERPRRASRFAPGTGAGEPPWDSEPLDGWPEEDEYVEVSLNELACIFQGMLMIVSTRMDRMEERLLEAISRGSSGEETPDGDGENG